MNDEFFLQETDCNITVSLDNVPNGERKGVVQAAGFDFPFRAHLDGQEAWLFFEPRRGEAESVFLCMEDRLRSAARQALVYNAA